MYESNLIVISVALKHSVMENSTNDINVRKNPIDLSRSQTTVMAIVLGMAYMTFGMLFGLMPQIYPEEAHRRGAVSSEVRLYDLTLTYHILFQRSLVASGKW